MCSARSMTRHGQSTGRGTTRMRKPTLPRCWRLGAASATRFFTCATTAPCRPRPTDRASRETTPLPGETIIVKHTNSAFIGTEFERLLRQSRIYTLVIMGVITNNSLEATVQMSGNLGFETYLVEDASFTFARKDYRGRLRTAEEVHDMSLANLDRQYCTVTQTKQVLQAVAGNDRMG